MDKNKILMFALALVLLTSFAIAAHTVTVNSGGTTYTNTVYTNKIFNISVVNGDTPETANITEVNITIPASFKFVAASRGSSVPAYVFTNTSTVLNFINTTDYLINNLTTRYFWFTANTTAIGSYQVNVTTTNATNSYTTILTATISDTTSPTSTLSSPANNAESTEQLTQTFVATSTDNYALSAAKLYIWDSSGAEYYTSVTTISGTSNSTSTSYTFPITASKTFTWNYLINDSSNNLGWGSANRTLIFNLPGGGSTGGSITTPIADTTTQQEVTAPTFESPGIVASIINAVKNASVNIANFFTSLINKIKGLF